MTTACHPSASVNGEFPVLSNISHDCYVYKPLGRYSQLGLRLNLDFGLQDFPLKNHHKKTALKLL